MENSDTSVVSRDERKGNWILTYTGKQFFLMDPRPEDVCIEDIAHALSNIGRFTGHAFRFYSVAEHSMAVSSHCEGRFAAWGLLHDAAEAYVGDVSRPLKRSAEMAAYAGVEDRILRAIFERFGMHHGGESVWLPEVVKEADLRMLMTEKRDLMPKTAYAWADTADPYPEGITQFQVGNLVIKQQFLELAKSLGLQ